MIFKDQELLSEAYNKVAKNKCTCGKNCTCRKEAKKPVKEAKHEKPDYLDADEDGDEEESLKQALKDKEAKTESLSLFKSLYKTTIKEESPYSNTFETDKKIWTLRRQIHPEAQYFVHYKDGRKSKPLKGESVLMTLKADVHDIESVESVHEE
jgi:hypothetical protein